MNYSYVYKISIFILFQIIYLHACEQSYVLVAHGFGSHGSITKYLSKKMYPSTETYCQRNAVKMCDCFNFSDYCIFNHVYAVEFNDHGVLWNSYLGQGRDLDKLQELFEQKIEGHPFVGLGLSRGTAAMISWVARNNPEHLKAMVLMDSVASMPEVIAYRFGGFVGSELFANMQLRIRTCYPFETTPIESIKNIKNKDLLIVMFCHIPDDRVLNEQSKKLYEEFLRQGFKHVYLIFIEKGRHCQVIEEEEYCALQSIYKQHGLVYDRCAATLSKEELQERYKPHSIVYDPPLPQVRENNIKLLVALFALLSLLFLFVRSRKGS